MAQWSQVPPTVSGQSSAEDERVFRLLAFAGSDPRVCAAQPDGWPTVIRSGWLRLAGVAQDDPGPGIGVAEWQRLGEQASLPAADRIEAFVRFTARQGADERVVRRLLAEARRRASMVPAGEAADETIRRAIGEVQRRLTVPPTAHEAAKFQCLGVAREVKEAEARGLRRGGWTDALRAVVGVLERQAEAPGSLVGLYVARRLEGLLQAVGSVQG